MVREKTIEKVVREFIANELTMNAEKIHLEDNLVNDLHADSMDIVNIVTAIESRFKIKFPDDSEIQYDGYTMQFLVDGVKQALKDKNPVRKAAKKVEEDVEAKKQSRKTAKTAAPKAPKTPKAPKKVAEKPAEPAAEE
jgi:Acyl carrier protein